MSLLLRYGTWACLALSAEMTSPSADSDLLMCCASFSALPDASLFLTRSEPARSVPNEGTCELNNHEESTTPIRTKRPLVFSSECLFSLCRFTNTKLHKTN